MLVMAANRLDERADGVGVGYDAAAVNIIASPRGVSPGILSVTVAVGGDRWSGAPRLAAPGPLAAGGVR